MKFSTKFLVFLAFIFVHLIGISQMEIHYHAGVPIGVSKEASAFIQDSFQLTQNRSLAGGFGGRYVFKNSLFVGLESSIGTRKYSSDSLVLILGHTVGTIFFGREFNLTEKFRLGASTNVGIQKASQSLYTSKNTVDAWDVYQNDTYTSFYKESNFRFFLGGDVYAEYGEGMPFTIATGLKSSFLHLRKVDTLNSLPMYQNYLMPYLCIRMNIGRDKESSK